MEADIVHTFAGFACRYTPTICDGPVFRLSPLGHKDNRFEVSASRNGVMVGGASPLLATAEQVFRLVEVLDLAGCIVVWLRETRENVEEVKRKIREAKETHFDGT